jgi:hypothetical protein
MEEHRSYGVLRPAQTVSTGTDDVMGKGSVMSADSVSFHRLGTNGFAWIPDRSEE